MILTLAGKRVFSYGNIIILTVLGNHTTVLILSVVITPLDSLSVQIDVKDSSCRYFCITH